MKSNLSAGLVIVVLSLTAAYAADEQQKADTRKSDTMKKTGAAMLKTDNAVIMPAQEMKWVPHPDFKAVKTAAVHGDMAKGPHHAFHKFEAGFEAPLHHHSPDYYATLLKGTMVVTLEGKEYRLEPGSFLSFAKKVQHTTRCERGSECLIFIDSRGPWDVVVEKAAIR